MTLAFTFGLSVAAGLLFGAAPALRWSRIDLARTLNEGSEQSTGGFRLLRSNRARATLAVAQVALALVLLTGAGVLLRSFVRLITVDRGYDPANVIAAAIPIPDLTSRPDMTPESMAEVLAAGRRFQESLVQEMDRLAALYDVEAAGSRRACPSRPAAGARPSSGWPAPRLRPTRWTSRGPGSTSSARATSTRCACVSGAGARSPGGTGPRVRWCWW